MQSLTRANDCVESTAAVLAPGSNQQVAKFQSSRYRTAGLAPRQRGELRGGPVPRSVQYGPGPKDRLAARSGSIALIAARRLVPGPRFVSNIAFRRCPDHANNGLPSILETNMPIPLVQAHKGIRESRNDACRQRGDETATIKAGFPSCQRLVSFAAIPLFHPEDVFDLSAEKKQIFKCRRSAKEISSSSIRLNTNPKWFHEFSSLAPRSSI